MNVLREFGQNVIQPLLMRLAKTNVSRKAAERLLPLVTVSDCQKCPALHHCLNACTGFRRAHMSPWDFIEDQIDKAIEQCEERVELKC